MLEDLTGTSSNIRWHSTICISSPRLFLYAFLAGILLIVGLALLDSPAVAAEAAPEAPITEACSGPPPSGHWDLCGTLNPNTSARVSSYFAINSGSSCTGGDQVPTEGASEVEGQNIAVSGQVMGLRGGSEYTYCLVAKNSVGETFGQPETFTTPGPEPPITEVCSGPIISGLWKLCGTLNPHSSSRVSAYFAYNIGASCMAGEQVAIEGASEVEGEDVPVSAPLGGLQGATEYSYCLIAKDIYGETSGQTVTFTTPARPTEPPATGSCSGLCGALPPAPAQSLLAGVPQNSPPAPANPGPAPPKRLTRAQKLAIALKRCSKEPKRRRASCIKSAHKQYGARAALTKRK